MKHYIVFLDRASLIAELRIPNFDHTWVERPETPAGEVGEQLRRATVAITNKAPITKEVLEAAPRLRLVAVAATGVNNVDLEACRARGVAVANIRGYAQHTVPEHVFMLLLALRRNLPAWRETLKSGGWQRASQFCLFDHPIHDLHGATLGIVGHGSIGQGVARLAEAFGMRVLIAERRGATALRPGYTLFEEVLRQADCITLHTPLNEQTRNLIGPREFGLMKRSAVLVNCARGGVVDEAALIDALKGSRIAGAATDVLSEEPPRPDHTLRDHPLLDANLPNLLITPHVAWSSREAMQTLADQLIDNIEAFVDGQPVNLVQS